MNPGRAGAPGAVALEPRWLQVGPSRVYLYDVGSGPAVVMLHGWDHHAQAWIRNIGPLVEAGYRVIAPDLPGFGRSGMPRIDYTLRGYARFTERLMDGLGVDRAVLVGSSMGGAIALRTAADIADRVTAVVGVDPAGMLASMPRFFALMSSPVVRLAVRPFIGRRRVITESHRNAYYDKTLSSPEQVDLIAEAHLQPGYREHFMEMAVSLTADSEHRRLWQALPSIRQPVLIVWGRQDRALPVQQAYWAAQRIPGSELVLYDQCGHLPMYERADDFNRDVLDFLTRRA